MKEAVILHCGSLSEQEQSAIEQLKFFGIAYRCLKYDRGVTTGEQIIIPDRKPYCVIASATTVADALFFQGKQRPAVPGLLSNAESVYVFGFEQDEISRNLLRFLTNDPDAGLVPLGTVPTRISITDNMPELCGPMSGIDVEVAPAPGDLAFAVSTGSADLQRIVNTVSGDVFIGVTRLGGRFYLNGCFTIQDIHARIGGRYFDIKDIFLSAVPTAIYLKWAFRDACWTSPEIGACLIVDDPLIKHRHGYLRYNDLVDLMDRYDFSTSIAFIPWNWRRTRKSAVNLFRKRSDRLSIAIHGCDHTGGEFAATSISFLNAQAKLAIHRMESMHRQTGLEYERVMVFPQGSFSYESMRVLKLNNFVSAANTEYAPEGEDPTGIKIAAAWSQAITKYGDFPLFTRRYMSQGIENFAFDALIGKPCLIVAHHDEFRDTGTALVSFINRLNALNIELRWRGLGNLMARSYQLRPLDCGSYAMRMYGNRATVSNPSSQPVRFLAEKQEHDPDCLQNVLVNGKPVEWNCSDGTLTFTFELQSGENAELYIFYIDKFGPAAPAPGVRYAIKVHMRRYLSEYRDNYLSRSKIGHQVLVRLKKLRTEKYLEGPPWKSRSST